MFERIGLMIDPCGVPIRLRKKVPSKSTQPAFIDLLTRSMNLLSLIPERMNSIRILWSTDGKHDLMSPSKNHLTPPNFILIWFRAVWHPFSGRKPCEWTEKVCSKTVSRIILIPSCTILSLGLGTIKGLSPPLGLGIITLRDGLNLKVSALSSSEIPMIILRSVPSKVFKSTPRVMFPGLLLMFQQQTKRYSGSQRICITLFTHCPSSFESFKILLNPPSKLILLDFVLSGIVNLNFVLESVSLRIDRVTPCEAFGPPSAQTRGFLRPHIYDRILLRKLRLLLPLGYQEIPSS